MDAADHLPPHFHVRMNHGRDALVEIVTLAVLRGSAAKRELAEALAWAVASKGRLEARWKEPNP